MDESKQVYIGKTLVGDILVQAETGGYSPIVTINVHGERSNFLLTMSPKEAYDLATMLRHAALAAGVQI